MILIAIKIEFELSVILIVVIACFSLCLHSLSQNYVRLNLPGRKKKDEKKNWLAKKRMKMKNSHAIFCRFVFHPILELIFCLQTFFFVSPHWSVYFFADIKRFWTFFHFINNAFIRHFMIGPFFIITLIR